MTYLALLGCSSVWAPCQDIPKWGLALLLKLGTSLACLVVRRCTEVLRN